MKKTILLEILRFIALAGLAIAKGSALVALVCGAIYGAHGLVIAWLMGANDVQRCALYCAAFGAVLGVAVYLWAVVQSVLGCFRE